MASKQSNQIRISKFEFRIFLCVFVSLFLCVLSAEAQLFPKGRRDTGPKPKNIHGLVSDTRGKPLAGARVFVRDTKTKVVRTLTTDQEGIYKLFALPPTVDYEVHAEFKGKATEKKIVSQFLNREDNVLNFQVDVAVIEGGIADSPGSSPAGTFRSFDLVDLRATLEMPVGIPAPVPAILLLHGYGEDRSIWRDFSQQLVSRGWAVMAMDLRGHGESKTKNQRPIQAAPAWRTSLHEFPVDLDPALDWLKAQPRIDNKKIVVIGSDVGANLALIASGRFPEVRTVVAINPNLNESLALAGSAQDFQPKSALIVTGNQAEGDRIKAMVTAPGRVQVVAVTGNTARWIGEKQVADAVFAWLKETF
jgi:pimeloyl-ACP methyl ester carboxylesterase